MRLLAGIALLATLAAGAAAQDARRSAFDLMSPQNQALQRDDFSNPAMLAVADGEALWSARPGAEARSCAECHDDARQTMRGVAARYPRFDERLGKPVDLAGRVNLCRTRNQNATAFRPESAELLALSAYVGLQSRGMPIAPDDDPRLAPFRAEGARLYNQRLGQLDLSCAQCHDERAGLRLGGAPIPQAHPTGYPLYRLEWQAIGSLQRRFRNCMTGVRSEPYPFEADEYVALELFLMSRAAGMPLETPAVRP